MKFLTFTVHGIPQTQGSKQAIPYLKGGMDKRGRPKLGVRVIDDNPKTKAWRAKVAAAAGVALFDSGEVLEPEAPFFLEVDFYLPRPKLHYGTGRNAATLKPSAPIFHTQTPDATKLLRAVEDAMKGIIWKDDSQVCNSRPRKFWTKYGGGFAVVTVRTIDSQSDIEDHFRGSCASTVHAQPTLL